MTDKIDAVSILANIPPSLRNPLMSAYSSIVVNYKEGRWEPSELNGGKLCEIVYTILKGHVDGNFPSKPSKPKNMLLACQGLESADSKLFPRSVRIQIPRVLIALYEVRNNRDVGHVGGEVSPNHMDAVFVLNASKWIMSELVRIFHNVDTSVAVAAVDLIVERILPIIWHVGEKKRILNTKLSMKDKTLLLLYENNASIKESDLVDYLEHTNASVYRRDVLVKLHKDRIVEYNRKTGNVTISPSGIKYVDDEKLWEY
jgi:hypothetical protein